MKLRHLIWIGALLLWPGAARAKVTAVEVYPFFETVGVLVTLDQDPAGSSLVLQIKGSSDAAYRKGHPLVRYDGRHMASSIFDLEPGTAYSLQVVDGASVTTKSFSTRGALSLPAPLRTVNVSSSGALSSALSGAKAGDLILLAPGNYNGGLTMKVSGTTQNPIVIRGDIPAAQKAKPIEQRTGLPTIQGASGPGLMITASNVVVEHVKFSDNDSGGIRLSSARSCVIQYCQVYDNGDWANILIDSGGAAAGYHLIQYNHVSDKKHNTPYSIETGGDDSVTYYGIRNDDNPGPCTVIRGNRIDQHYDGITPCPDEEDTQKVSENDNNVLATWPVHDMEVYDNVIVDQRDDDIEADGVCVNTRIYRNQLGRSGSPTSISPALPGPYFWVRNVMTDFMGSAVKFNTSTGRGTIRNIYYYHNTIVRTDSSTDGENATLFLYDGTPSKNVFFRNNIFTGKHRSVVIQEDWVHKPDMDHDLWYAPESQPFVYWGSPGWKVDFAGWKTKTSGEAHGVWGDPQLDAKLVIASGSKAKDKGVVIPGINDGYTGTAPDVGHFELGGPVPPPLDGGPLTDGPRSDGSGPAIGDGASGDGAAGGDATEGSLDGGCCRVGGPGARGPGAMVLLVLLGLALLWRRRG